MRKIFSLNLICFLRCNGQKESSVGINKETNKVYFVFDETEELKTLIEEYKDRDKMVRLHDFISEFKTLKEEMYRYSNDLK